MTEQLSFQTDAAVIDRLGRELVAKQETALAELVKNGYDADATKVEVRLFGSGASGAMEVRDNGNGMDRDELIGGFLRLASDNKVREPRSPKFDRQRAGRKGIGRFSAQRLGHRLQLTTTKAGADHSLQLTVDWDRFVQGIRLDDVPVELKKLDANESGTVIRIDRLRDHWSEAQIKRVWRNVLALQQPFPVAPVEDQETVDPGFNVRFLRGDTLFADESIVADMQTEILDHLHAIIEMRVDDNGVACWRIVKNRFGPLTDWQRFHHDYRNTANPPSYEHLRDVWLKAYHAILKPELLPTLVFTRVRDVLSHEGGIRLYRNGFRVPPFGDPDNDWLGLDQAYSKRSSVLAPVANRNFFGVVEVKDPTGVIFEEHTSREGLIETPAFLELQAAASAALLTAATSIQADRGRKTHASAPRTTKVKPSALLEQAEKEARETQARAERTAKGQNDTAADETAKQAANVVSIVEKTRRTLEEAEAEAADESSMLRLLATLGMTMAEFSHESSMTFDAVRIDFDKVVQEALKARSGDSAFENLVAHVQQMFSRLDALTSYLNGLAAARSMRSIAPVSLSRSVEEFERGMRQIAGSMDIALEIDTPPFDALYTAPMHTAELASVLLNLYTNAVKAMKRAGGARKLLISADRVESDKAIVRVKFADTGDGISEQIRERIFDPFFTTQAAPAFHASDIEHLSGTGLGLWIIKNIVANARGEIGLVDPPDGYATCFEIVFPGEED